MIKLLLAALIAVPVPAPAPSAPVTGCAALSRMDLPGVRITSAALALTRTNEFCQVEGHFSPGTSFTIKLPPSGWTGQYVQHGCSGLCGEVPALDVPVGGFQCEDAINGKLVLAASDTGHQGDGPATWGYDPRKRIEFGLTSEHKLRNVATAVMTSYYGRGPSHRYFTGCSTGGRQALNLAQRYPADFDGILAGAPANNLSALSGLLNPWLVVKNTGPGGRPILPVSKLPALHSAVARACGDAITDPRQCAFQPSSLRCPPGQDKPTCLTGTQVAAVTAFYRGPTDSQGRSLYNGGVPYGSELSWTWFLGPAAGDIALNYLRYLAYPHNPPASFDLGDVKFTKAAFDRLSVVGDAIYNANNPDLSAFRAHGGKIILWHGWADASIPPWSTIDYYRAVERRAGGFKASQSFSRLYLVPAGYHCLFGPADPPTEIGAPEFLTPLMTWVEGGDAPDVVGVPTIAPDLETLIRYLEVSPHDALAPVAAAPGSLNSGYRYVGRY
ncbi:tannase/feruloyl esterase family alpha/beta hydrolase [Actinoplanes friuliensis]|uniref:Feruloyl esterase n=1 Tax=Actinoplanes friuliensis DSM 7358 TaxID=1246995 RepID=U5W2E6_9ACTN|nr:tannase/feruloyl esterase family alpha/beta hydrolase [Actinoplanes friuliensis]AGZ43187.1 hypothetical protein AFR_24605 [Actinoplanes friuliensis DSM 7358]